MKIASIILFLLMLNICRGQEINIRKLASDNLDGDTLKEKLRILYIINNAANAPIITTNLYINPLDIDSVQNIAYGKSSEVCKAMRVSSIWIIVVKPKIKFVTLNEIFNIYHIDIKDQSLPVRIDNWIIDYPEQIVVERSEIVLVGINKPNEKNEFINIKTLHPLLKNKFGN